PGTSVAGIGPAPPRLATPSLVLETATGASRAGRFRKRLPTPTTRSRHAAASMAEFRYQKLSVGLRGAGGLKGNIFAGFGAGSGAATGASDTGARPPRTSETMSARVRNSGSSLRA